MVASTDRPVCHPRLQTRSRPLVPRGQITLPRPARQSTRLIPAGRTYSQPPGLPDFCSPFQFAELRMKNLRVKDRGYPMLVNSEPFFKDEQACPVSGRSRDLVSVLRKQSRKRSHGRLATMGFLTLISLLYTLQRTPEGSRAGYARFVPLRQFGTPTEPGYTAKG